MFAETRHAKLILDAELHTSIARKECQEELKAK